METTIMGYIIQPIIVVSILFSIFPIYIYIYIMLWQGQLQGELGWGHAS